MNKQNVIYLPVSVSENGIAPSDLKTIYYRELNPGLDVKVGSRGMEKPFTHWLEPLTDQYLFTRDQLAEYLANYSFHISGAYNKNNAEKYIEGDWRNYKQE